MGGEESHASAINNLGQIAGESDAKDGTTHAFLWHRGTMTDLGSLGSYIGGSGGHVMAINEGGEVIGTTIFADPNSRFGRYRHGFLWKNGRMRDLGTLGGRLTEVAAINERGQIVGRSQKRGRIWHASCGRTGR